MINTPLGRALGIVAGYLATLLTEQGFGEVSPETLLVIFMSVYSAVHSGYRYLRRTKTDYQGRV